MKNIKPEDITHYHCFNTHFRPLSYSELNSVAIKKEKTLNLSFQSLMTEDMSAHASDFEQIEVNVPITFNEEIQIFSLIDGGWLPLPFVNPPHFLVDSNVIINLEKLMKNPSIVGSENASWWLQMLNSSDVIINPILYAFEGKEMKTPKFSDFVDCFEDSTKTIQNVLPNAGIIKFSSENYATVYKIVKNSIEKNEKQKEFLLEVNSLLYNHISRRNLFEVELKILNIAKRLDIKLNSLLLLITLSCLYESNDNLYFPVARNILKFSPTKFNEKIAFNALSDLTAIELFVGSGAVSNKPESPRFSFCTSDKSIALFGCGLNFKNGRVGVDGLTFTISITKELFPILDDTERQELLDRLLK